MPRSKGLLAVALVVVAFSARSSAQTQRAGRFVAGEILVKFKPGATANAKADAHRLAGGTPRNEIARTGVQLVTVPAGDQSAAMARYQRNPNVLYAEPNFIRTVPEPVSHSAGSEVVPGDYYFREQWALHNTGQEFECVEWIFGELCLYVGTPDADIDAPEAWAISTGSPAVRVAVIDTGIDYTHPDLAANYAGGYNYVSADGSRDPLDDHGHGTHVSGTIAAALDNPTGDPATAEGVVGVAPNVRILAYKVCRSDGSCDDYAIEQALIQAITDGAKVINMSLGGPEYSRSMDDAVQTAWNAGLVIVAGAGNEGTTDQFYPAALPNVISVAAFDEDHKRAPFSNYGWVAISAPGNVIMSTYPLAGCVLSGVPGDTGCYAWMSGTSMATPHVSGAAALVWSRSDVTSNQQVVDILLGSADPGGAANVRLDTWTIHGGLNLHNALSYGLTNVRPVANAGADQTLTDADGNGTELVALDGAASSDSDGTIVGYEWREGTTVVGFGATPAVWLSDGIHTLTLEVTDDHGANGTDDIMVTVTPLNHAPAAQDTSATTVVGTPVAVTLNATDLETCDLAFSVVQGPASGVIGVIENQACVAGTPNHDSARIIYSPGAVSGTYSFTYKTNDGSADSNVSTATITVTPAVPPPSAGVSVTGINPNAVSQNIGTTTFVVTGTGFADGASVTFANGGGPAPRVLNVRRDSSTQLTANVEIRSGGPRKNRLWDVRVTNPDGSTGAGVALLAITP